MGKTKKINEDIKDLLFEAENWASNKSEKEYKELLIKYGYLCSGVTPEKLIYMYENENTKQKRNVSNAKPSKN